MVSFRRFLLLSLSLAALGAYSHDALAALHSSRQYDPVVMSGDDLAPLYGLSPSQIVAFRYDQGWQQIPVQIDQRAFVDLGQVYDNGQMSGVVPLVYNDPDTFTGADPDAAFDSNDELVFMARDAGGVAVGAIPSGTVGGTGRMVAISDPLQPGQQGYVYLFQQDGTLDPAAGQDRVSYQFNLLSGDYKTTYKTGNGLNPENSTISSSSFSTHFSDRWIIDELSINAGASTGVDILDRNKVGIFPGNASRTEETFSQGGGAMVANIDGPLRAIRSYVGANSGPYTQRDHKYYEQRQDTTVFHRVHEIVSSYDFYDYNSNAVGMTYYNDVNTAGVTIDGTQDSLVQALPPDGDVYNPQIVPTEWELVTGPQGSVVHSSNIETTIADLNITSFYLDDDSNNPLVAPVTGDAYAYGQSGVWLLGIPCTDPTVCPETYEDLAGTRVSYYREPGITTSEAGQLNDAAKNPLEFLVSKFAPALPGDFNLDDAVDVKDLGILATHYGNTTGMTWLQGDANGDYAVNVSDLGILASNYGTGTEANAGSVPEPGTSSMFLLLAALGCMLRFPKRDSRTNRLNAGL